MARTTLSDTRYPMRDMDATNEKRDRVDERMLYNHPESFRDSNAVLRQQQKNVSRSMLA